MNDNATEVSSNKGMNAVTLSTSRAAPAIQSLEQRCIQSCLSGLAVNTVKAYAHRIAAWQRWSDQTNGLSDRSPLDREHVKKYIRAMELAGQSAQCRNQALAALKRLAGEAAELGWLSHESTAQIERIKSTKITGIRTGRWLTAAQCSALIKAIDQRTITGKRDAVVIALLLGGGLRRAEACSLETAQLKQQNDRLLITNLVGKGGRVRSVQLPGWAAQIINQWRKDLK